MQFRKSLNISVIWLLPALLVLIESIVFLPRNLRTTNFLPYFIAFWSVRALLAPAIVFYTFTFWIEHNRVFRLALVHLLGFFLFSALFWSISYLLLNEMMYQNPLFGGRQVESKLRVFTLIADNSLSTNILVYASTVGFCYLYEYFKRNAKANKKANELERSLLVSRLELLKSQLNSHFLFNTLHTISSLVVRNKNEEANQMLIKLSDLLRFALKENKEQLIPLEKELEILQLYLDIQQMRFKERLEVRINYPTSLNDALVPALILQPVVENSVKYAVEPFKEKATIDIDINTEREIISVKIIDNGQTPFHTINFEKGIGLTNTRERLEQLFGDQFEFCILPNKNAGTTVKFELPLQFTGNGKIQNTNSR